MAEFIWNDTIYEIIKMVEEYSKIPPLSYDVCNNPLNSQTIQTDE